MLNPSNWQGLKFEFWFNVAWKRSASLENDMSSSESTRLFPLDQNATQNYFTLCDVAGTGKEIRPVPDLPNKKSCTADVVPST